MIRLEEIKSAHKAGLGIANGDLEWLIAHVEELESAIEIAVKNCAEKTQEIIRLESGIEEIAILNADHLKEIRRLIHRINELQKRDLV
jgi:3-dehydroquinate synthase class II